MYRRPSFRIEWTKNFVILLPNRAGEFGPSFRFSNFSLSSALFPVAFLWIFFCFQKILQLSLSRSLSEIYSGRAAQFPDEVGRQLRGTSRTHALNFILLLPSSTEVVPSNPETFTVFQFSNEPPRPALPLYTTADSQKRMRGWGKMVTGPQTKEKLILRFWRPVHTN